MAGNARRHRRHSWQWRQCGFCNFQILKGLEEFESHPLRHSKLLKKQDLYCCVCVRVLFACLDRLFLRLETLEKPDFFGTWVGCPPSPPALRKATQLRLVLGAADRILMKNSSGSSSTAKRIWRSRSASRRRSRSAASSSLGRLISSGSCSSPRCTRAGPPATTPAHPRRADHRRARLRAFRSRRRRAALQSDHGPL
jgi:hypothetical protein